LVCHIQRRNHRLRVFWNRVLRKMLGNLRSDRKLRKSRNKEFHDLYSSDTNQVIILKIRWEGHVACMGQKKNVSRVMMGKPERKGPFGRPRHRWKNKIKN
jgi:hypothetical protein